MIKCVFFDRDGIVNRSPGAGYVERWEDFHIIPEFVDVLQTVRSHGYEAVVITNQRGVALGRMTLETVFEIHTKLQNMLRENHGLRLLDIRMCPHNRGECTCRKPQPGMLLAAAERHGIDLAASWMIGDRETDIEAGRKAGCRTVLVSADARPSAADLHFRDMQELRRRIAGLLTITPA
jgi:D-glycero-D-manno-heptose 1,7-bisphosphate phosphatase